MKLKIACLCIAVCYVLFEVCTGEYLNRSAIEIFWEFCPGIKTCTTPPNGSSNPDIDLTGVSSCCSPCSCDEYCWDRGNCCPDVPFPHRERTVSCRKSVSTFDYFVVDSCPEDQTSLSSLICLLDDDPRQLTEAVYVSDVDNHRVFRNKYCAECNGITDYIPWNVGEMETGISDTGQCESDHESVQGDIDILDKCGFISVRPNMDIHYNAMCLKDSTGMLDHCPSSSDYNTTVRYYYNLCEKYKLPFYVGIYYRNVFCFICNQLRLGNDVATSTCTNGTSVYGGQIRTVGTIPFTKIFNIKENTDSGFDDQCESGEIYDDYMEKCLELSCGFGYTSRNSRCVRNVIETFNAVFRVRMEFNIHSRHEFNNMSDSVTVNTFTTAAKIELASLRTCFVVNEKAWVYPDKGNLDSFLWQLDIYTSLGCQDDDIGWILREIREDKVVVVAGNTSYLLSIVPYDIITPSTKPTHEIDLDVDMFVFEDEATLVNAATFCNAVILTEDDITTLRFDILRNADGQEALLSKLIQNLVYSGVNYELCWNSYANIIASLKQNNNRLMSNTVGGYLSLACTVLSMVCAGFTVVVNIIFDRSYRLPKYVLLMVCANLILAQGVFQFGIGARVSRELCILIGSLIHYLWLAHTLAMSSFVFGVVIKLRKGISNSALTYSKLICHVLYIYGTPIAFVILNVVVSKSTYDNTSGYGEGPEKLCYISTAFSRIVFFMVPICIVVGLNISAYLYFVWLLVKVKIESEVLRIQRSYIQAYARLSCVTGVTWLFGLISELISSKVFEYFFIVTNCGQGIALFFAFGRIKNLYRTIKARGPIPRSLQAD